MIRNLIDYSDKRFKAATMNFGIISIISYLSRIYLLRYRNMPRRLTTPQPISNPGVLLLSVPGILVFSSFAGCCSTSAAILPLFCSGPGVLFSGCITVPVVFILPVELLTSLLLTMTPLLLPPLLWLLPPLLPPLGLVTCSTFIVAVFESVPFASLTVSLAVYVPGAVYTLTGFTSLESAIPSLLKSQLLDAAFCERSVNFTDRGAYPLVGLTLKSATGELSVSGVIIIGGIGMIGSTVLLLSLVESSLELTVAVFSINPLPSMSSWVTS